MTHSRRQCMKVDPPNTTIPAGKSVQFKLDPAYRGEQWFSVAISCFAPGAADTGVTFGDCWSMGGDPAFVFPLPKHGFHYLPGDELPPAKVGAEFNTHRLVSFFGEPTSGLLGITNTTDQDVTVQIVHCDRMFQED